MYLDGKNESRRNVKIKGYRCIKCDNGNVNDTETESTVRRWSNPQSWPSGKVPVAGEDVEVQSGWNMLYDIADGPILNKVFINGKLTFEDGVADLHLRANYIWVRAGELIIGTASQPYVQNAKITLYGNKNDTHIDIDNGFEGGNKLLLNSNKIMLYGT